MTEQLKEYIISAKDFESFAYQMKIVFPLMPQPIRDEWQVRINRVLSHPAPDVKELFRKEIAKWKEEDPLFMAYVHGQEAERKEARQRIDAVIKELEKEIKEQKELMKRTTGHHQEIHRSIGNALEYTLALLQAGEP